MSLAPSSLDEISLEENSKMIWNFHLRFGPIKKELPQEHFWHTQI